MTRGEAVIECRDMVNEASSTDLWTDAQIVRYLDQGQRAMCRTRGVEETWLQYLSNTDMMNYPADWKQLLRAYYVTSTIAGGTASAGGTTSLTDATMTWAVNTYLGDFLVITDGLGIGQVRRITSNTATALTVATWTVTPDITSTYAIYQGRLDDAYMIFVGNDFDVHDGLTSFHQNMNGVVVLIGTRLPDALSTDEQEMDLPVEYAIGAVEFAVAMMYYKDDAIALSQQHMALFAEVRQHWEYAVSIQPMTIVDLWYSR